MAGAAVEPKILRDPPTRLGTPPDRTHHAAAPALDPAVRAVRGGSEPLCPMRGELSGVLDEVRLQLELDQERGATPLPVWARAPQGPGTAGDRPAERQALIAEIKARNRPAARSSTKPNARRAAQGTANADSTG